MRSFHLPGRSTVHGTRAMIATSHPLASQAGIEMLRRGGNAIDAAITATAVMCVVEPAMTGIGGDCFTIIAKAGQKPIALNGSGRAPKGLPDIERSMGRRKPSMPCAQTVAWCPPPWRSAARPAR